MTIKQQERLIRWPISDFISLFQCHARCHFADLKSFWTPFGIRSVEAKAWSFGWTFWDALAIHWHPRSRSKTRWGWYIGRMAMTRTDFLVVSKYILIPYLKCWSPRLTLLTFTSFKIFEGAQSPAFPKDSMKAPAVCLVPWVAAVRAALNHGGTRRPKRDRREAKRKQLQLATVDPVPWECLERYPLVVKHPGGCKIVPQFKTFQCCSLGYQIITRSTFPLCC